VIRPYPCIWNFNFFFFWYIDNYTIVNKYFKCLSIKLFIHVVILKISPPFLTQYICTIGFMLMIQHDAWWNMMHWYISIHNKIKQKLLLFLGKIVFTSNYHVFIDMHTFSQMGLVPPISKGTNVGTCHQNLVSIFCWSS